MANRTHDCLIIGGGPAGLTAAIYLTRFHLDVVVVDAGHGRVTTIPLTRNHAGFPDGISGAELVDRMRRQTEQFGARMIVGEVTAIERVSDMFAVTIQGERFLAPTALIATGVINRRPPDMPDLLHDQALACGLIRYCPICDGFEVTDKQVAVFGTGERGFNEAQFLRSYTSALTMIAPLHHDLELGQRAHLIDLGISLVDGPVQWSVNGGQIGASISGRTLLFDSVYPALGSDIRSGLAARLGAACSDEGCLLVDAHMRTDIPGLYAAGDVVKGLDQISHAMGEGGVAATTIRNDLAQRRPLIR